MRRVAVLAIALALAAASGGASAQSLQFSPYPAVERHGQPGAYAGDYDYARVLRVDPVFDGARGYPASQQRCYTREDRYTDGYGRDGYRDYGSYGGDRYGGDGYGRDAYGRDTYGRDGYDGGYDRYGRDDENRRMVASVVGGVVGAVLGSKVGGGSGRYATAAIGTMVGGIAGREIYDASQRNRVDRVGRVTVCDPVPDRYGSARYPDDRHGGVAEYDVTYEYGGRRYTTRTDYHPGDTIRVRVDVRPE